jgi:hypothetical protein
MSMALPGRLLIRRFGESDGLVGSSCGFILGAAPMAATGAIGWPNGSAGPL